MGVTVGPLKGGRDYAVGLWKKDVKRDVGPIDGNGMWRIRQNRELLHSIEYEA